MKKYLLGLIPLLIILFFLRKFAFITDTDRVKKVIKFGQTALKEEKFDKLFEIIDVDFKDSYGHDYKSIRSEVNNFFSQVDCIEIDMSFRSVRFLSQNNFKTALCSLRVRIYGNIEGEKGLFYGGIRPAELTLNLIKRDSRWLVNNVKY